jgi:hypothetical protein
MKCNTTPIADKKAAFLNEFSKCNAIKTIAARRVKISRTMLYEYINSDPIFAFRVREIEEAWVDYVESKLQDLVNIGHPSAIIFYLKSKGRDRGYR